ncbi:MAG TPA: hypothetical protein VIN08_25810 [Ohtaekwangia sp.]|uniref:hypothetical protein n=1 Tax=Ohtaekwangia sp. TaxID=2066019 RepID=UPI002F93F182
MTKTLKSIGAVLAGLIAIFALSHVTDLILEKSGAMKLPFDTNPLWLKLFVTIYRTVYVAIGCYITAALAPAKPMKHVYILASIGVVLGILGAVAMWHEPPHWYPIALIVLSIPAAWAGGKLRAS